jgi:hypothetical protein
VKDLHAKIQQHIRKKKRIRNMYSRLIKDTY